MRPLEGIKVVDFTQTHAGSLATMILADYGAEIIKIERAGVGDLARYWEPTKDGESGYYAYLNRGKKSLSINAFQEEGKDIIKKLIKEADVICNNFKYGSMERMGFSYEEVKEINPEIIYASLNGYGQTGPMVNEIGLDLQLQSMSGLMDITGFEGKAPTKTGAAIGDQLSGTYMALAINLAIANKKKTGKGQKVDIAILDSLFAMMGTEVAKYSITKEKPKRKGNLNISDEYVSDVFKVKDGYVLVEISTPSQVEKICEICSINIDKKLEIRSIVEIKDLIEEKTKEFAKEEIIVKLLTEKIPCSKVNKVHDVVDIEIVKNHNMLIDIKDKALGDIKVPGLAIKMKNNPGSIESGAPLLGEHTEEYLTKLGYSSEQIKELIANKVVETV